MRILGLIPARYASTRFPGKPLANISGKPMIQWVYEKASSVFEHVYVATDDARIAGTVSEFGGKAVLTRDSHQSGTDRCAEAIDLVEAITPHSFDVVVNIQGDEPFIQAEQLLKIASCFTNKEVQIATLAKLFTSSEDIFNPNIPKVIVDRNGYAIYFSRSVVPFLRGKKQDAWATSFPFYKHIGLYAYRSEVLRAIARLPQSALELAESLEQLRWVENGYSIKVEETNLETLAVDTPADLERAKALLEKTLGAS